jgi:hypothetical protein
MLYIEKESYQINDGQVDRGAKRAIILRFSFRGIAGIPEASSLAPVVRDVFRKGFYT